MTRTRSRARRAGPQGLRIVDLATGPHHQLAPVDPSRLPWPGAHQRLAGADIYVRQTPPTGEKPEPALYVHGLGGASTNFTDAADLLSPWFDGHALDLPGFGKSGPPAGRDYSMAAHSRLVIEYLEGSGRGPVHLVGNSMGGAISIRVAANRPDLIRTLTLVSPAVPDLRPHRGDVLLPLLLVPGLGQQMLRQLDRTPPERRATAIIELCFAHPEKVPDNRMAEAIADVTNRRGLPWAHEAMLLSLRGLVRSYVTPGAESPWRQMARITAPTTIIWGELDALVDVSNAPKVTAAISDSTLLVVPDVGHTAQLEDPVLTARTILALRARANDGRDAAGVGF